MKIVVVLSIFCMSFVPCNAMYLSKIAYSSRAQNNHFIAPLHRKAAIKLLKAKTDLKNNFEQKPDFQKNSSDFSDYENDSILGRLIGTTIGAYIGAKVGLWLAGY